MKVEFDPLFVNSVASYIYSKLFLGDMFTISTSSSLTVAWVPAENLDSRLMVVDTLTEFFAIVFHNIFNRSGGLLVDPQKKGQSRA